MSVIVHQVRLRLFILRNSFARWLHVSLHLGVLRHTSPPIGPLWIQASS